MIRFIEALDYCCLRYVHEYLDRFHILVGPNASGKSTFLDVAAFLAQLVQDGLEAAVYGRSSNFRDLVWQRREGRFELAVQMRIPEDRRSGSHRHPFSDIRYEVSVGPEPETGQLGLQAEKVLLTSEPEPPAGVRQLSLFPEDRPVPPSILSSRSATGTKTVVNKVPGGDDNFYDETGKGWAPSFRLGPQKSALANLPDDESKFPAATWLKRTLMTGVQKLTLSGAVMRRPSPPGQSPGFRPDGSNLPWVVADLQKKHPQRHNDWVRHVQTALPDVRGVEPSSGLRTVTGIW